MRLPRAGRTSDQLPGTQSALAPHRKLREWIPTSFSRKRSAAQSLSCCRSHMDLRSVVRLHGRAGANPFLAFVQRKRIKMRSRSSLGPLLSARARIHFDPCRDGLSDAAFAAGLGTHRPGAERRLHRTRRRHLSRAGTRQLADARRGRNRQGWYASRCEGAGSRNRSPPAGHGAGYRARRLPQQQSRTSTHAWARRRPAGRDLPHDVSVGDAVFGDGFERRQPIPKIGLGSIAGDD